MNKKLQIKKKNFFNKLNLISNKNFQIFVKHCMFVHI